MGNPPGTIPRRLGTCPPERPRLWGDLATAVLHANKIRKLYRAGMSKSKIARRLQLGRTSVRHILTPKKAS